MFRELNWHIKEQFLQIKIWTLQSECETHKPNQKNWEEEEEEGELPVSAFADLLELLEAIDAAGSSNRSRLLQIQLPTSCSRHILRRIESDNFLALSLSPRRLFYYKVLAPFGVCLRGLNIWFKPGLVLKRFQTGFICKCIVNQ